MRAEIPFQKFGSTIKVTNVQWMVQDINYYRELVLGLTAFVAAENQPPFGYYTAATWWDMFKAKHFPKWLLAKYPAKTIRHEIGLKTVYPFLRSSIPSQLQGDRIQVMIMDRPIGLFVNGTEGMTPMEHERYYSTLFEQSRSDFCQTCFKPLWERK